MAKPASLVYDSNCKCYIFGQFTILFDEDEGEEYCTVAVGVATDPQNEVFDGTFKECIDYCLKHGAVDFDEEEWED